VPPMTPAWLPAGPTPYGIGAVVVLALLTAALCRPLLAYATARPEPTAALQASGPDRPPDYRTLGTTGFVLAVGISVLLAGAVVAVAGAVGYGLLFALVWRLGRGGLGFGDVRLSVALGAATAACSPAVAVVAAVLGTSLGAVWAVGRLLRGRRGIFPYGPFLL